MLKGNGINGNTKIEMGSKRETFVFVLNLSHTHWRIQAEAHKKKCHVPFGTHATDLPLPLVISLDVDGAPEKKCQNLSPVVT